VVITLKVDPGANSAVSGEMLPRWAMARMRPVLGWMTTMPALDHVPSAVAAAF